MIALIAGVIAIGWIIAFTNPDPVQSQFLFEVFGKETPHIVMTSDEVEAMLVKRYGPDRVDVTPDTEWKIPRWYDMPIGYWCRSHINSSPHKPSAWDCKDYSAWAAVQMTGYSFGTVNTVSGPFDEGHRMNVFVGQDDDGVVKIGFYEPQICQWVAEPDTVLKVVVK